MQEVQATLLTDRFAEYAVQAAVSVEQTEEVLRKICNRIER